uniref:Zeta-sarcoglycan n=1 Tax=Gadus morhua TaxID=8049 RepID=A0A8C5B5P0_GADMO
MTIAPVPNDVIYTVGLYGWRKRCLYFLLLLFLVTMIVNLALTVWIIKVMNLSTVRDSALVLRSERNVTLNVRNSQGHLTGQLTGRTLWKAQCRRLEVRSRADGQPLFSADADEIRIGTRTFTVTGSEGAVFRHSVETPLIQSSASEELKLESPTRTLTMGAPRGVEVTSAHGALTVGGRKDLQLQSTEGEIILDAATVRLASLPLGVFAPEPPGRASPPPPPAGQATYEVCVCPSGKLYLSPAASSSTCQAVSNICLWS